MQQRQPELAQSLEAELSADTPTEGINLPVISLSPHLPHASIAVLSMLLILELQVALVMSHYIVQMASADSNVVLRKAVDAVAYDSTRCVQLLCTLEKLLSN